MYYSPFIILNFFLMTLTGIITKVIGVVIDVEFSGGKVPEIYEALEVE